ITESPSVTGLLAWKSGHADRPLPVKLDFVAHAHLPANTRAITIEFPKVLGDAILTIDRPGQEPLGFPLLSGETSPALELPPTAPPSSSLTAPPNSGESSPTDTLRAPVAHLTWLDVSKRYIILGFTHILPGGFDHVLFVCGLFLLSPRVKALLWQITAFTIAHSLTLTLTTLHLLTLPSIIIEPTIAASIAFIAIENLSTTRVHRWRPVVAFIFGLVHGMGFASALSEVGLPTGQLVAGLISFNIGVECGHLTVLAAAFLLLGWTRTKPWYRPRIAIPLSLAIAAIALVWFVQRVMQ
ncbi:MAG: HupE/UreJ family protein, partial [Phycisphaerales bacterium]